MKKHPICRVCILRILSTFLIIAFGVFLLPLRTESAPRIDLVNPMSGLLGFGLGGSREGIPEQAETLRLEYLETRILREGDGRDDLITDFYTGRIWGQQALIYLSSRGVRIRNMMLEFKQVRKGEEFTDAIRIALSDKLGEPSSSTREVAGRRPDYVHIHRTIWRFGDIEAVLTARNPDKDTRQDISLSYYLTAIR